MNLLSKQGFIESIQGKQGGYKIAKSLTDISLLDIVNATENYTKENMCFFGFQECPLQNQSSMHDKWGEVPVAFIEIHAGSTLQRDNVMEHCKQHLAGFKVPKYIIFAEIPKTSTGKVQKFELRQAAKSLAHETPKVTASAK